MSITNTIFLFCFLPLSLAIFYLVPASVKDYVLLFLSLLFYACGSPDFLILFIIAISITVALGRFLAHIDCNRKVSRRIILIIGILLNVSILGYYKYAGPGMYIISRVFKLNYSISIDLIPLGISFFTFKAISYLADIYLSKINVSEMPVIHDALYLSFFAQIQAGPISRYSEMSTSNASDKSRIDFSNLSEGIFRFLIGFSKKVLFANVFANITNEIFATDYSSFSTGYAWLGAISYSLELFFDFAGYSDMAIGLTKMFGYDCRENFIYPYMTESISKFWRRWHISLSEWFRDYIYIPLGGSRAPQKWRTYLNLLIVWLLTGIWHGYRLNYIFWGLGYFVLIAFERATGLPERIKPHLGKVVYRIFTLAFIVSEWVIFRSEGLSNGLRYIGKMFIPCSNTITNHRMLFIVREYGVFFILGILLCFPIYPYLENKVMNNAKQKVIFDIATTITIAIGFIFAFSFVIAGQNNPFAYANF